MPVLPDLLHHYTTVHCYLHAAWAACCQFSFSNIDHLLLSQEATAEAAVCRAIPSPESFLSALPLGAVWARWEEDLGALALLPSTGSCSLHCPTQQPSSIPWRMS